uniref:Uncharacterized protein n=1 Tax=Neospora caninum (strain Liverpool) TaxID=572307 RepID=A0A0F7UN48_NEOCL|nr:TPA: hypothetical protein, conserved [Neospora caninum Liverpool]
MAGPGSRAGYFAASGLDKCKRSEKLLRLYDVLALECAIYPCPRETLQIAGYCKDSREHGSPHVPVRRDHQVPVARVRRKRAGASELSPRQTWLRRDGLASPDYFLSLWSFGGARRPAPLGASAKSSLPSRKFRGNCRVFTGDLPKRRLTYRDVADVWDEEPG